MLHSICQKIWKTQQWSQEWKRSVFIPTPKMTNVKECSNYHTIARISHVSKVMLKIRQARFQQYMNWELLDVQAGFRKGRGSRDQIVNIHWTTEKAREIQKNIYLCFIDYAKAFDCVNHNKLWKILKEMGISGHLTCLLRNLQAGQEETEPDMERSGFKLGKEYVKVVYSHHEKCCARWITSWHQDCWEKYQQPQIGRWYHSNGRKWRGTQEPLDEGERGESKRWLETQHSKTKIVASDPITSWQIDGETMETVTDFIFLAFKITADGDCSHRIKRHSLEEKLQLT